MKALLYCRVSTVMQEDADSLVFQKKKCEEYCRIKGYEITKILDDVESGAKDDRLGFLQLKEEIKNKTFDILIVFESSRVSRNSITMQTFVISLQEQGIKFCSVSQPELDTTTPTGMLFFQIQASLGEYERKQISVRVKSSKWARVKDGKWQGGNIPIGYIKTENGIEIDDNTSDTVKNIFYTFLENQSINATSSLFGKPHASIQWILKNPFYLGKLSYGKKEKNINTGKIKRNAEFQVFEAPHEQLIDAETFEAVQTLLKRKNKASKKEKMLFSSLIKCMCGSKMHRRNYSDRGIPRVAYACSNCKKSIQEHLANDSIIEHLLSMDLNEFNNISPTVNPLKTDRYLINKNVLSKCENERKKYLELFSQEIITQNELTEGLKVIANKRAISEKIIEKIEKEAILISKSETYTQNIKLLKDVLDSRDESDTEELNKIFKLLIDKVEFINRKPLQFNIYIK